MGGRTESGSLEMTLLQQYPAAFSAYRKQCRGDRIQPGTYWLWREARPMLAFLVIRVSSVGATRLRYVEAVSMMLARDYRREGIQSLALAPLGNPYEWPNIKPLVEKWLGPVALPIMVYDTYLPGVPAEAV